MRAATLFSGIGAPECARPDWQWLWHAEIEPFPAAVMQARHRGSLNLGNVLADDFAERAERAGRPDVLVFGSPCQSFSVAGKRLGLSDPRGNLALVALALVRRLRPGWFVFENVPGLLSSERGEDYETFLGAVAESGYSGCWRVLDARYWHLAQRRERVFFVGSLGDWRGPAAVLSLAEGMRGYPEKGREAGERVAEPIAAGSASSGGYRNDADTANNLIAATIGASLGGSDENDAKDGRLVVGALLSQGKSAANATADDASSGRLVPVAHALDSYSAGRATEDGTGRGIPLVPVAYGGNDTRGPIDIATAVNAHGGPHGRLDFESETFVTAFDARQSDVIQYGDMTGPLDTDGSTMAVAYDIHGVPATNGASRTNLHTPLRARTPGSSEASTTTVVSQAMNLRGREGGAMPDLVRRLTPRECERLQGFPDDFTAIDWRGKPAADGPRYRALGNSMAVPVLRWLLTRIEAHERVRSAAA
jgi:DNA (cytosine-5)-methyltransferase 1